MTDSTIAKIAVGMAQLAGDMLATVERAKSPDALCTVHCSQVETFADRLKGYMTELSDLAGKPSAGTDAYTMISAIATAEIETTETLIHMVTATVLSKLIDEEGGGRTNVTFGPFDMDEMMRRYELHATREGMDTVVSIKPREGMFSGGVRYTVAAGTSPADATPVPLDARVMVQDEDTSDAKPQVEAVIHDRPLWAARIDGKLHPASDEAEADRLIGVLGVDQIGQVENRFCYHQECPTERCVKKSAAVPKKDTKKKPATK